jgi:hypothetical protein
MVMHNDRHEELKDEAKILALKVRNEIKNVSFSPKIGRPQGKKGSVDYELKLALKDMQMHRKVWDELSHEYEKEIKQLKLDKQKLIDKLTWGSKTEREGTNCMMRKMRFFTGSRKPDCERSATEGFAWDIGGHPRAKRRSGSRNPEPQEKACRHQPTSTTNQASGQASTDGSPAASCTLSRQVGTSSLGAAL